MNKLGGNKLGSKVNDDDVVNLREALNMEITINQALIDILGAKGILTQEELMQKIDEIRREWHR